MASDGVKIKVVDLQMRFNLSPEHLKRECTREHLLEVALLIGDWELLAAHLGLQEKHIEDIKRKNVSEEVKRKNALLKWKATNAYNATYEKLLEALLKIDDAEVACQVCKSVIPKKRKYLI